jgi:UDP-N-acetylmuramoylalanine--D-glutamate ligase
MKVLLLGLGRANMAVARYLLQRGDDVYVYEESIELLTETAQNLIQTRRVKMYHEEDDYELVITSPGFPPNKDIIQKLKAKNISVIDEIEFTYTQLENPRIIAVTGTNGKSTTVSLISHILNTAHIENFLGGNIAPGTPFSQVLFMEKFQYYVLEISSFQLMRIERFHPMISVITNITTDHLNWHKDFDEYKTAKSRILLNQDKNDFAVLNFDDTLVRSFAEQSRAKIVFFGTAVEDGVRLNGNFYFKREKLFSVKGVPLVGRHNLMNIAAAIAAVKVLAVPNEIIDEGIRSFKSIPHRLEEIGTIAGVRYVNNSMCTNESAAIASFVALEGAKIVIVGGKLKGDTGHRYLSLLAQKAKACIILGENAQYIAQYFRSKNFHKFSIAENMDDAIRKARVFAEPHDIILLNPGFASFDYYRNFEKRGEAFRNAAYKD